MFNEHDLKLYRLFKQIIGKSKIEIEGGAVPTASLCFTWFEQLEKRIQDDLKKPLKTSDVTIEPLD